ncbi:MAG: glycerol-3-phosphate dehydrogenase/oxidase [Flavitalea sp.]
MTNQVQYPEALQRKAGLLELASDPYCDILIIGGGATGLGIALDGASRGYRVILLERADFAKGTSGRSTKLIHGGVRYLEQGNIRLVREASIERALLCKNAPHLVSNQTFIIPLFTYWEKIKYTIGLKAYDWIAGTMSLGSSGFLSREKTLEQVPGIKSEGLIGSVMYHDGQFDDARLALNLAQTAAALGATLLNYCQVTGLHKNDSGQVNGVTAIDLETNRKFSIEAKCVVNATGVFVDDILQMDNHSAEKSVRPSQGVHLVIDKKFFPSSHAMMIPSTSDGRVLFAVPWHNKVLLGTTDTPVRETSSEPVALETEINFILSTASAYLSAKPKRSDVMSVFAGLRPLAAPKGNSIKSKEISRSHKILVSPSMLFTMVGGKWTTFRKMAEDMVDHVEKELHWPHKRTRTVHLPVHGHALVLQKSDPFAFYGSDGEHIRAMMMASNKQPWISEKLSVHPAQVVWAVRNEMARTVEDVLSRRTRSLLLDARESMRMAPAVAAIMAHELGKDEAWIQRQVEAYNTIARNYALNS